MSSVITWKPHLQYCKPRTQSSLRICSCQFSSDKAAHTTANHTEEVTLYHSPAGELVDATKMEDATCHLLNPPPELRNRIYELVLIKAPYIETKTFKRCATARQPALTGSGRQIRNESLSLFYQANVFRFLSQSRDAIDKRLKFGSFESHIPELRHIEIASRFHAGYFTLDLTGIGNQDEKLRWVRSHWTICRGSETSWCFANPKTLIVGNEYLQTCERAKRGGVALTAGKLEMLTVKLEVPHMGWRDFRRLAQVSRAIEAA